MNAFAKLRRTGDKASRFLSQTVVRSMEGILFVLLSSLLTLAGARALLEDSELTASILEAAASTSVLPAAVAGHRPLALAAGERAEPKR